QRQLAAPQRQVDAAQRLHLHCTTAQRFRNRFGFDDGVLHRMNTVAGSMRTTRTMAPIAEATHITTVRTDSATISQGVMTIGSALLAVIWTTTAPRPAAMERSEERRVGKGGGGGGGGVRD